VKISDFEQSLKSADIKSYGENGVNSRALGNYFLYLFENKT